MATGEEVSTYYGDYSKFDLKELVKNAMWRDLLIELVESNKLDPWNIDIAVIAEEYLGAIKRMKVLDLHVPANIIFAASVLLRMKSEMLHLFYDPEQEAEAVEPEPEEIVGRQVPEVPGLIFKLRMQPRKKITLEELMDALEEAMKVQEKREQIKLEESMPVQIRISREDIGMRMRKVFGLIKAHADSYKMATFADLAGRINSTESVLLDLFVPLLFLAHRGYITLSQDEFFDEIFVRLKKDEIDDERE